MGKTVQTPKRRQEKKNPKTRDVTTYCTPTILPTLKAKKPSDLLIIFGTGLSAAAYPKYQAFESWRGLLHAITDTAEHFQILTKDEYKSLKKYIQQEPNLFEMSENLIQYLTSNTEKLAGSYMDDCIQHIFQHLGKRITRTAKRIYCSLYTLLQKNALLCTCNFDTVFEEFIQSHYKSDIKTLTWKDPEKLAQWSRGEINNALVHMHGVHSEVDSLVLHTTGFTNLLMNREAMSAFKTVLDKRNAIFIGIGLTHSDVTFSYLLGNSDKVQPEHYYFVAKDTVSDYSQLRAELLQKRIKIMPYGSTYNQLPAFLERLVKVITRQNVPAA